MQFKFECACIKLLEYSRTYLLWSVALLLGSPRALGTEPASGTLPTAQSVSPAALGPRTAPSPHTHCLYYQHIPVMSKQKEESGLQIFHP